MEGWTVPVRTVKSYGFEGKMKADKDGYPLLHEDPHCVKCHKFVPVGALSDNQRRKFHVLGYCMKCLAGIEGHETK